VLETREKQLWIETTGNSSLGRPSSCLDRRERG